MILQSDMPIPVWGKAETVTAIVVKFANLRKKTVADSNGKWRVNFKALKASFEPGTIVVTSLSDEKSISISDVLFGEVWICSGQSNMKKGVNTVPEIKNLVPLSSNIRSFTVKNTVVFKPQETCEGKWEIKHPNSAVAFSFAYFLQKPVDVPVGVILTSWGSSSIEAWMPRDMTETVPHYKIMMNEFDAGVKTKNRVQAILKGLKPWSNSDDELEKWMQRYRKGWDNEKFHFLVVMLPGYRKILDLRKSVNPENPDTHSWDWMRESQLKAQELSNTSVVNSIDLGDVKNIYPKDKLQFGKRLSLLALHNVLNNKIKDFGPTMKKIKKNSIVVHFNNVKVLKTIEGKSPTGFWLSDTSERWVPANVKIKGKTILLTTSEIENPIYILYAFTGKPNVNLVNEADLPTYPFRLDNFKP